MTRLPATLILPSSCSACQVPQARHNVLLPHEGSGPAGAEGRPHPASAACARPPDPTSLQPAALPATGVLPSVPCILPVGIGSEATLVQAPPLPEMLFQTLMPTGCVKGLNPQVLLHILLQAQLPVATSGATSRAQMCSWGLCSLPFAPRDRMSCGESWGWTLTCQLCF